MPYSNEQISLSVPQMPTSSILSITSSGSDRRGGSTSMTLTSRRPGKTASAFISAWNLPCVHGAFQTVTRSGRPLGKYVTRAARAHNAANVRRDFGSLFVRTLGCGELQRLRHGMSGRSLDRRRGHEAGVRNHIGEEKQSQCPVAHHA